MHYDQNQCADVVREVAWKQPSIYNNLTTTCKAATNELVKTM